MIGTGEGPIGAGIGNWCALGACPIHPAATFSFRVSLSNIDHKQKHLQ